MTRGKLFKRKRRESADELRATLADLERGRPELEAMVAELRERHARALVDAPDDVVDAIEEELGKKNRELNRLGARANDLGSTDRV